MEFKFKVGDMVKHVSPFAKPQRVTGVHRINGWNFLTFHEALPKQSELFAEDAFELSDADTTENERFLGLNTTKPSRRDELQKGVRLHAENWYGGDYPQFKHGDIVWTHGAKNVAQIVHHQDGINVFTEYDNYHILNIEFFVLQPEPEVINLRKVDFEMLKGMLRHPGTTSILSTLYSNPTQEELANLALFFEMLGKSSSFSHLAHKQLKSRSRTPNSSE
jgi:hypothetical protein